MAAAGGRVSFFSDAVPGEATHAPVDGPTQMCILVGGSRHNVCENTAYDFGRSAGIGEELEGREWEIYLV